MDLAGSTYDPLGRSLYPRHAGKQEMYAGQERKAGQVGRHRLSERASLICAIGSRIRINQSADQLINCGFDAVQLGLLVALLEHPGRFGKAALAKPRMC